MRGIILAGGTGSRLYPLTSRLSKQILPVYDKPMIYYPLATLMAAGIREIMIISTERDLGMFEELFHDGSYLGLQLTYAVQKAPKGIAESFLIAEKFIGSGSCALILGDNLFHGTGLGRQLMDLLDISGCQIFAYKVADTSQYGVIRFDESGKAVEIEEKPSDGVPGYAIPGLYFFDSSVVAKAKVAAPSKRGELEITSLLNEYLRESKLNVSILPRGTAWLDTGTFEGLHDASSYVRLVEERQGAKIACIEEVAWRQGWISTAELSAIAVKLRPSPYAEYLESLISEEASRTW
jgi:glucose-1-phosphate thymidylyltransferase